MLGKGHFYKSRCTKCGKKHKYYRYKKRLSKYWTPVIGLVRARCKSCGFHFDVPLEDIKNGLVENA